VEHPQSITNKQLNDGPIPQSIWLRTVCRKNGRDLKDDQIRLLEKYVALLLEWNAKINLISRRNIDTVWRSHIAHSIVPLFKIDLCDQATVLDLGSGGGLPGIPWRILLPSISVTMIDATQKKVKAVRSILNELGLSNTSADWGRAEELGRSTQFRSKFDYVVARGVGPIDELAKLAKPFLRHRRITKEPEGIRRIPSAPALLAFKGGDVEGEMGRAKLLKGVISTEIIPLSFAGSEETELEDKKLVIVHFDHTKE
jgi:16S rRNA (guanine527-N7)-methyltransferase